MAPVLKRSYCLTGLGRGEEEDTFHATNTKGRKSRRRRRKKKN